MNTTITRVLKGRCNTKNAAVTPKQVEGKMNGETIVITAKFIGKS